MTMPIEPLLKTLFNNRYIKALTCTLIAAPLLSSCAGHGDGSQAMQTLQISALYRERKMLPPEAVLTVTLEDVSLADAPSVELSRVTVETNTAPPYLVTLNYDDSAIDPRHRYTVRGKVTLGDKLLMTNTSSTPAFNVPQPVQLMLQSVNAQRADTNPLALTGQQWQLRKLAGNTVETSSDRREPFLSFKSETEAAGFAGCNNFFGRAAIDGYGLTLGPLGSTMMACQGSMKQEQEFLAALAATKQYAIDADTLTLMAEDGSELASFSVKK